MSAPKKWRCTVCGYIHEGDAPPDKCPLCSVGPELFVLEPDDDNAAQNAYEKSARQLVIIGAGVAGTSAAEAARKKDPDLDIRLISKEPELPYYRINISRYLAGEIDAAALQMHDATWYEQNKIRFLHGEVQKIDRLKQQVFLLNGDSLDYDKLIIASGSHPFFPPIMGIQRERVWALRSKKDADEILAFAQAGRRCVVIGGGLLGLEAAGALRQQGVSVEIVEGAATLLSRQLAPKAAALLQTHIEELGMQVHCAAKVQALVGDEAVRGVQLADGPVLPADFVIIAAGIRPNVQLAADAGLTIKRGIEVDAELQTLDADVYAAGDLAEYQGIMTGLWMSAFKQGQIAGANAATADEDAKGLSYLNDPPPQRLKVLNIDLFSIGAFLGHGEGEKVFEAEQAGHYIRVVCNNKRVIGANLLGDASLGLSLTHAVEKALPLEEIPKLLQAFPQITQVCT